MNSKDLLEGLTTHAIPSFEVNNLCNHSQRIKAGDVFLAYPGHQSDGRTYLASLKGKPFEGLICEAKGFEAFNQDLPDVPIALVDDLQAKLSSIAQRFFETPSQDIDVIGITGTNGKTTVCHLIQSALEKSGQICGRIGTLGVACKDIALDLGLTTPDAIDCQRLLRMMVLQKAQTVAMEVSSHALDQHRVQGIAFDTAVYTNLSQDHLDYHASMDAYAQAKAKLFAQSALKQAIINADDPHAITMMAQLSQDVDVFLYSRSNQLPDSLAYAGYPIVCQDVEFNASGIRAKVSTPWGTVNVSSRLIGEFNLSNLLAVIGVLGSKGVGVKQMEPIIRQLQPVQGRMQHFVQTAMPQVIVDYAHTPDALEKALKAAKNTCQRKLWCVFGCGGDRDKQKRSLMGQVAAKWADQVIVTNDNPRTEDEQSIVEDILQGIEDSERDKVHVELDRKKAITRGIEKALSFDVVLIAGKGHESYQILGKQKVPFSDIQVVKKLLG